MAQDDVMKGRADPEQTLAHLADGMVVLDETGRILYANAKVKNWAGALGSLKGKSCFWIFRHCTEMCPIVWRWTGKMIGV